jgi:hypothetical protein
MQEEWSKFWSCSDCRLRYMELYFTQKCWRMWWKMASSTEDRLVHLSPGGGAHCSSWWRHISEGWVDVSLSARLHLHLAPFCKLRDGEAVVSLGHRQKDEINFQPWISPSIGPKHLWDSRNGKHASLQHQTWYHQTEDGPCSQKTS